MDRYGADAETKGEYFGGGTDIRGIGHVNYLGEVLENSDNDCLELYSNL